MLGHTQSEEIQGIHQEKISSYKHAVHPPIFPGLFIIVFDNCDHARCAGMDGGTESVGRRGEDERDGGDVCQQTGVHCQGRGQDRGSPGRSSTGPPPGRGSPPP